MGAGSFYVTTPIYYVNAAPHLGHAYTTIAADVMARQHRQRGEPVFFLTGTDEHGEPVAHAAAAEGVEPQVLADRNAARFLELTPQLQASNDFFIRTSNPEHVRRVQAVLEQVRENGYVYEGTYEGWYCPRCADFKTEQEVAEGNTCPIHHIELTRENEQNWFFRLSDFQEPLERLFDENPDFVSPKSRFNEARSFIAGGLQDVSLSRRGLDWGVPLPWDPDQVAYVWWDALLNYYTGLGVADPSGGLEETFWPPDFQLIGKDILKFHAIYWPALLMAAGLEVPRRLFVHGFLLMDGEKMSKSLGNVLDPVEVVDRFGADALRFYLMRDVPFGADGSVSPAAFDARYETELANEYGNLAGRSVAMVHRYRGGQVPAAQLDPELAGAFEGLPGRVAELIDEGSISQALEEIWERVRRCNRYVEEQAPWQLAKEEGEAARLDVVPASLIEGVRALTVMLSPWLPASAGRLLDALGAGDESWPAAEFGSGSVGTISELEPLFPKDPGPAGG